MRWAAILVVGAFLCVVSGMLGLTAGINFNPSTTVTFVPNWGSLGDWASAIGAFSAVAFALWQSHKQQQKELPKVKIIHRFSPNELLVRVVSEGVVPESILGADFIFHKDGSKIDLLGFSRIAKGGPDTKLQRGDHLDVISLNKNDIYKFAEQWVAGTISKMRYNNITPGDGNFYLDRRFFDGLEELFNQEIYILIRLVSKDVIVKVDPNFVLMISNHIVSTRKTEETERVAPMNIEARECLIAGQHIAFGIPKP